MEQPRENSGTWEPDAAEGKRSEEELIADYRRELAEEFGTSAQQLDAFASSTKHAVEGVSVQSGHEPDRFGFWAVESLIKVRRPARRRGQNLRCLCDLQGATPSVRTRGQQNGST